MRRSLIDQLFSYSTRSRRPSSLTGQTRSTKWFRSLWRKSVRLKRFWRDIRFFLSYDLRVPYWLLQPWNTWQERRIIKEFPPGTLIEDCSYHPCIVLENDGKGDLTTFDLVLGHGGGGCSIFHCGVIKLSLDEVHHMLDLYKEGGDRALLKYRGYSPEDIERFYTTGYAGK